MKFRWFTIIGLWQLIGLVVTFFVSIPAGNFHHFIHQLIICLTFTNMLGAFGMGLYAFYRFFSPRFGNRLFWFILLLMALLLSLAVTTRVSLWIGRYVCGLDDFQVNRWHLFTIIVDFIVTAVIFLFAVLLALYEKLASRLEKKIRENEKLQRLQIESRLTLLQSRINPHFLFNTLNTMLDIVKRDPDTVEKIILNLSDIYRKTLSLPDHHYVTLDEEMVLVREYLEIEKVRMGERLDYTFQVDSDVEKIRIPPMVIQMLVENAVKHGLSPKREGGKVSVNISKLDNAVKLEVEDTGVGFEPGQPQNGFGLKSIQQRLQLLYNNAKFDIVKPASGTLVRIVLPYAV